MWVTSHVLPTYMKLSSKFSSSKSHFKNGSITRRNVSIKLLPGNVDFEVEEKFETINSSSSSPPLTPVTPLSPTMSPTGAVSTMEETATMKRNTSSLVTSLVTEVSLVSKEVKMMMS